ncbi:MAG: serine hydrolase [Bacteroidota bacterium]
MKKIIVSYLFLLVVSTHLIAQVNRDTISLKDKIDTYLSQGVSEGFSGAVLVAKEGQIVLHKGYGMARKEDSVPYKATTVSTIGSVTKQFTATAILKLEELNLLNVEDSIHTFFSNLPDDKKDITLHQLLTHTSGLVGEVGEGDFDEIPTEVFFNRLFASPLQYKPGTKYAYSNAGYSVLARIIELVSGMEYESFLHQYLFKPAGMTDTGYFIPDWKHAEIASGYAYNVVGLGTLISRFQKTGVISWNLKGNGGIHSTTGDMFKWYQALKNHKVITQGSFKKLTTPYVQEYEDGQSHYAYGWAIYRTENNSKIISHNGGNGIFFHDYIWLPEEDIVIILFTNASSRETEVAWPIRKMMFDADYQVEPIKRNIYQLTHDFIKAGSTKNPDDLIAEITDKYRSQIKSPSPLNRLGYRILKKELIQTDETTKWAIAIFKLNTALFPNDGNSWDSLGEAYVKNNQKSKAVESYKKALQLAPKEHCDWCESSRKALKELRKN